MAGVSRTRARKEEARDVELITPHGAEITVSASRAAALLARPPIPFGDHVHRKYARAGESNVVGAAETAATPPRKGSGANSGGE